MARVPLAILAVGLALAACGGEGVPAALPPGPASVQQLIGPWQPQPFVLDSVLRATIEQTCRTDMGRDPGSAAAVIDARGEGVAVLRMVGPSAGACDALQISASGQVAGAGGGWTAGGVEQLVPVAADELSEIQSGQVGGGELKTEGWSVMGRAGQQVAAVVIEPAGVPPILATLENGWFAGWWPATINDQLAAPPPQPDVVVRGYDAAGMLLDEVRP